MTALGRGNLQIKAVSFRTLPPPLQCVSMLLEGRFDRSFVESHEQVLYWGQDGFDEDMNECSSSPIS